MDDLLQEFIAETRETLEALASEIVAWESDPTDRARLDAIFRFVHTVKGSCGFLDLPRLARLSHAAEDVLAAVRAGTRVPDAALVTAVLAIVDRIGEIVEAIDAGAALDDSSEELLMAALHGPVEAAAAPAEVSPAVSVSRVPTRSVRLSVDLLDRMMSGVSEMVLARNELARRLRDLGDPALEVAVDRLSHTVADLRDTVSRTRMQTVDALFSALPRVVRDTAAQLGKQVTLEIAGGDVELDREMIEMLRDPLVHMVRNALDHGIETPVERRAAGKRESGRLSITARQSGNRILVEIADDGRGIDTGRLVAKLVAADPVREGSLRALDEAARAALIFEPGLSSRDEVTEVSGRGVGMDVVRANVEQVGGRVSLANAFGQGLTVTIEVPLTLAIISAVVIEAAGLRFAVPRQAVSEIVSIASDAVRIDTLGDAATVTVRGRRLPMVALDAVLRRAGGQATRLMILDVPGGTFALAVTAVTDTEELVVKPAAPAVMASGIYAGQTLPDNGEPLLLLDGGGVAAAAGLVFGRAIVAEEIVEEVVAEPVRALLFEDRDGARRVIPLRAVDRIETAPAGAIRHVAGRWWVTVDGVVAPLVARVEHGLDGAVPILRLHQDERQIGYAIGEAIDIVDLPDEIAAAEMPGAVSGVVLIEGEPVELLDPLWLVAENTQQSAVAAPICLLAGTDSGWMAAFLKPAIERAGYRVSRALAPGETADVTLAMDDDAAIDERGSRVVRLSRDRAGPLYRYDSDALLAVLKQGGR